MPESALIPFVSDSMDEAASGHLVQALTASGRRAGSFLGLSRVSRCVNSRFKSAHRHEFAACSAAALQIIDGALRAIVERTFAGEEAWASVEDALARVRKIVAKLGGRPSQ